MLRRGWRASGSCCDGTGWISSTAGQHGQFRAQHRIPQNVKLVLGVCRRRKALDLLLRAFAKLPAEPTTASPHLAFVGPDDRGMKARLMEMAQKYGIGLAGAFRRSAFRASEMGRLSRCGCFCAAFGERKFREHSGRGSGSGNSGSADERMRDRPAFGRQRGTGRFAGCGNAISRAIRRVLSEPDLHAKLVADAVKRCHAWGGKSRLWRW